ncbi:hypothetical protein MP638_001171 [Amoeboaphelidium occidentale]|nr:hypothetical protein MP638_001171 [Amoeboaphelidium occidentale]
MMGSSCYKIILLAFLVSTQALPQSESELQPIDIEKRCGDGGGGGVIGGGGGLDVSAASFSGSVSGSFGGSHGGSHGGAECGPIGGGPHGGGSYGDDIYEGSAAFSGSGGIGMHDQGSDLSCGSGGFGIDEYGAAGGAYGSGGFGIDEYGAAGGAGAYGASGGIYEGGYDGIYDHTAGAGFYGSDSVAAAPPLSPPVVPPCPPIGGCGPPAIGCSQFYGRPGFYPSYGYNGLYRGIYGAGYGFAGTTPAFRRPLGGGFGFRRNMMGMRGMNPGFRRAAIGAGVGAIGGYGMGRFAGARGAGFNRFPGMGPGMGPGMRPGMRPGFNRFPGAKGANMKFPGQRPCGPGGAKRPFMGPKRPGAKGCLPKKKIC